MQGIEIFFTLKMMVKSGLDSFILKSPSEIPANLPGQFSRSGQIFFALGSKDFPGFCVALSGLKIFILSTIISRSLYTFNPIFHWSKSINK